MTLYSSYLRVYEPLTTFPPAERRHWERYLSTVRPPDPVTGIRQERRASLVAAIGLPPRSRVEHAFVHRLDTVTYVCPWRTALRTWEAIAEFRRDLPEEIADAFIPRGEAEIAERELERWRAAQPDLKSHILSETWEVPLQWFLPFEGEERRLELAGDRSLSYRTTMANSRRRLARGLSVLRKSLDDGPILQGVESVGRWLEEFHPRSLVELDYGGLVSLFDDDELTADESAADVAHAVACLSAGDTEEAAEAYQRVTSRWGALRAYEAAN
ncbi:MAG TPA: hypothetical protein VEZ46_14330 [Mycobacteriales bacterium]|nr:hypothetical protein [Mycobacteriales bacterium]